MNKSLLLPALAILITACASAPNSPPSPRTLETHSVIIQEKQLEPLLGDESTQASPEVIAPPPAEDIIIEEDVIEAPAEEIVLEEDPNAFTQTGKASWYGKRFHGRKTANGERFDMHAFTAAHRKLPMNSYVEVTNLSNNQSVIVRVNDRGPFTKNRIIDLSYASAKKIGMVSAGVVRVKIRQVTKAHFEAAQEN